ncbi:MAG: hypothetical protein AAGF78_07955 [Pseudomonadota bacterium]
MSDTPEELAGYEARLGAALGRIAAGVAKWPDVEATAVSEPLPIEAPSPAVPEAEEDADALAALRAELEEERTANAQLNQRVKQIRKRHEERVADFLARIADAEARAEAAERTVAKMRNASEDMRRTLSDIDAEGTPDAHLVNRAMMAELEALRAERAADATEIAEVMSALAPLVQEGNANA